MRRRVLSRAGCSLPEKSPFPGGRGSRPIPFLPGSRSGGNEQKPSIRGFFGFRFLTGGCHAGIRNEKDGKTDQQEGGDGHRRGGRASGAPHYESLREDRRGGTGSPAQLRGGPGRSPGGRAAFEDSDHAENREIGRQDPEIGNPVGSGEQGSPGHQVV